MPLSQLPLLDEKGVKMAINSMENKNFVLCSDVKFEPFFAISYDFVFLFPKNYRAFSILKIMKQYEYFLLVG